MRDRNLRNVIRTVLSARLLRVGLLACICCVRGKPQSITPFSARTTLQGLPPNTSLELQIKLYDRPVPQPAPPSALPFWQSGVAVVSDNSGQVVICLGGTGPWMLPPSLPSGHPEGYLLAYDMPNHVYVTAGPFSIAQPPAGPFSFQAVTEKTAEADWRWLYGSCAVQLTRYAHPPAFVPLARASAPVGFFDIVHFLAGASFVNGENTISPLLALSIRLDSTEKRVLFSQIGSGEFDLTRPDMARKSPLTWAVEKRLHQLNWPTFAGGTVYLPRQDRFRLYLGVAERLNSVVVISAGATRGPNGIAPTIGFLFELRR